MIMGGSGSSSGTVGGSYGSGSFGGSSSGSPFSGGSSGGASTTGSGSGLSAPAETTGPTDSPGGLHDNIDPDDNTLRDRIESEIFRDELTSREFININVVGGIAEIRGEQPTQADMDALIRRVQGIRDVRGVHSYLHLPGTEAPNKAEVIQASEDAAQS